MAGVSRTMWLKGIYADAATMKATARRERDEQIKVISGKWKADFKRIKEENDELQVINQNRYLNELHNIEEMTRRQIAQGPPA